MNFIQSIAEWYQSLSLLEYFFFAGICGGGLFAVGCWMFFYGLRQLHRARELADLNRTIAGLNAEIDAKTAESGSLTAELDSLRSQESQAKQTIADGEAAKTFLDNVRPEIDKLSAQKERLVASVNEEANRYIAAQEELNKVNSELQQSLKREAETSVALSLKEAQVQEKKKEIVDLNGTVASSKKLIKELTERIATLGARKVGLEEDIQKLNESLASLSTQVQELTERIMRLTAQKGGLDEDIQRLKARKANIETEVQNLKETRVQVGNEVASLEGRANVAMRTLAEREARSEIEKDYWRDLDIQVVDSKKNKQRAKTSATEQEWLHEFHQVLSDTGFHFSERTLNAFHTGLKCGNETPLVVLAGISGTGKSLLPELYAAWAGFNFLSVPVQPRWDGPQDLLGFHNGLEGRYKATELARFLWQADWHHNKDGKYCFGKDALNLILLDEMNLARVEYYFSDFLSKLEQRRNIEESDEAQIANASISLEAGTHTERQRQLYLGSNTFIVGTMNEDETTQMLSDKVIDRSNVLRFGRPSKLKASKMPNKSAFLEQCTKRISSSIWATWSSQQIGNDKYATVLEDLNVVFSEVGRPFGHRVAQAVNSYLTNYPDQARLDQAFADQIEMKVLPKLNGLDLSTPGFSNVQTQLASTIALLNDPKLDAAFRQACDTSTNTFFKWRGVMRSDD